MSEGIGVIVTDYGNARIGPKFGALIKRLEPDLKKNKRTKAYKRAAEMLSRIESAAFVMAEAEWLSGGCMVDTP